MKHSEGEWKYELYRPKRGNAQITVVIPKKPRIVTYVLDDDDCSAEGCSCIEDDIANAKLIASAPELLEALKRILKAWDDCNIEIPTPELELINQVIKKATL